MKTLWRLPYVIEVTGNSRATIYRGMAKGSFPAAVRIGERAVAWVADEVEAWIRARIAERDATSIQNKSAR